MIEVALFGAGRIGKIHAGKLTKQAGVHLKYVVDVHALELAEAATLSWHENRSVMLEGAQL